MKDNPFLNSEFYQRPETHVQMVNLREMKRIYMDTNGQFISGGRFYKVINRRVCPGVYELTAKRWDDCNFNHGTGSQCDCKKLVADLATVLKATRYSQETKKYWQNHLGHQVIVDKLLESIPETRTPKGKI